MHVQTFVSFIVYTRMHVCRTTVFVSVCLCVAGGRLNIVSPLRASLSLQHVGTMVCCQDTSPSSVLTRRHEEQRLIIYKQTPVHHVWLGTSPALNVTIYEAIHFIVYSIQAPWNIICLRICTFSYGIPKPWASNIKCCV